MDPKLVRLAKEIPARLKEVMNSMFEQSQPTLRSGVSTLRESLKKLDHYLLEVDREHLGKSPQAAATATKGNTYRKRGNQRFPISDFVLAELRKSTQPMRPVDLAVKLSQATGRDKANASANIHTLLSRLREQKKIVRTGEGLYSIAGGGATTPANAGKKKR